MIAHFPTFIMLAAGVILMLPRMPSFRGFKAAHMDTFMLLSLLCVFLLGMTAGAWLSALQPRHAKHRARVAS